MSRRPPRSTRTDTLFPYTTLFRSPVRGDVYHSDENLLTAIPGYRGKSGWQARAIAAVAADMRWPFIGEFAGGTQTLTPRIQVVATPPINNLDIPNEDSRAFHLEDSNLFELNRFNVHARTEDGSRIPYGPIGTAALRERWGHHEA